METRSLLSDSVSPLPIVPSARVYRTSPRRLYGTEGCVTEGVRLDRILVTAWWGLVIGSTLDICTWSLREIY